MNSLYNKAAFLLSAAKLEDLPSDQGKEVAFIGRSNAGKSSAINAITGIKGLARASKTPGRTQLINIFKLNQHNKLVDLPGYGYAKAPITVSQNWMKQVNLYLQTRKCLCGLILIMDIRHPLKKQDWQIIEWAAACELPLHILLTKADKLSRNQAKNTLLNVDKELTVMLQKRKLISLQIFSAHEQIGLQEVYSKLDSWLL